QEQAKRRRGLDERGIVAAFAGRRVFGHIGGGTTILTTKRQTLGQTQADQNDRRGKSDRRRIRQQANDEGRQTHDEDGNEEGVFAADDIADTPEHDGAEGTNEEAGREGEKREDIAGRRRIGREELRTDNAGERPIKVEVIPFENGTERRSKDNEAFVLRHAVCSRGRTGNRRHWNAPSFRIEKNSLSRAGFYFARQ